MATERVADLATGEVSERTFTPVIAVPQSVSPMRARLALKSVGLLATAEAAVLAAGEEAQIMWEYATEFRRDDPTLNAIGTALGMSSAQMDQLFITAARGA